MIKVSNVCVHNVESAFRGMRNPLNSWEKSDSKNIDGVFVVGPLDLKLAKKLCKAGSDHRKFMRQIIVSCDILAPLYWWKEFDTYKVATVSNSTSTMHTIHKKRIEISDFSCELLEESQLKIFSDYIEQIEEMRKRYIQSGEKKDWEQVIQMLPSSYNQLKTCTFNFETMLNMVVSRSNHKLREWRELTQIFKEIDYFDDIIEGVFPKEN